MNLQLLEETGFIGDIGALVKKLPKPYALMREGERLFPSCLMGNPDTGEWTLTDRQYWDLPVEGSYFQFAAPVCPPGYRIVHGNVVTADSFLIWRRTHQYWSPIPDIWKSIQLRDFWHAYPPIRCERFKKHPAMMYLLSSGALICTPIESSWRTMPLPANHRALNVSDVLRRGDRRIAADTYGWNLVPTATFGNTVTAEFMENIRFARPIPPRWHHWYIDLRDGRGNNTRDGSKHSKACSSVDAMLAKINEKQRLTGIPLYGVIWDVSGIPAYVLDVPLDAPLDISNVMPHTVVNIVGAPHSISWLLQHLELAGEKHTTNALLELAHESLPPLFRELTAADVCQEHDIIFTLSPGNRLPMMWQPAPAQLWHCPGSRLYVFARHSEAHTMMESPEIRLLNHAERLLKLEKLLIHVAEKVDGLVDLISAREEA